MTQEEKIKDLEQRLAMVYADNSALCTELEHWKKVAAGLKGRNKQLGERVAHYKALDLEGDHLYEDKISELDEARKEIEILRQARNDVVPMTKYQELELSLGAKKKFIEQLQDKVKELMLKNTELQDEVNKKCEIIDGLENTINESYKPWWKKIF